MSYPLNDIPDPLTDASGNEGIIHCVKMDPAYITYEKIDYLA